MGLIAADDQARLREELSAMTRPVRLLFFTQTFECETCPQTRQILDELPLLSDKITIEEINLVLDRERATAYGIDRVPAVVVLTYDAEGVERDSRIRFLGTPSGYEFLSLIKALKLAGGVAPQLSDSSRTRLSRVDRPMTMQVFTTPTCPHCPRAVDLAHEMAWANPNITAWAVEVTEYPDLARRYRVSGVPKTVVDEEVEILGAVPEEEFVQQALAAFSAPDQQA